MQALIREISGAQELCCNGENFIAFQMVIMKCARDIIGAQAIRRNIMMPLDTYKAGKHHILVEDTVLTHDQYLSTSRRKDL